MKANEVLRLMIQAAAIALACGILAGLMFSIGLEQIYGEHLHTRVTGWASIVLATAVLGCGGVAVFLLGKGYACLGTVIRDEESSSQKSAE